MTEQWYAIFAKRSDGATPKFCNAAYEKLHATYAMAEYALEAYMFLAPAYEIRSVTVTVEEVVTEENI